MIVDNEPLIDQAWPEHFQRTSFWHIWRAEHIAATRNASTPEPDNHYQQWSFQDMRILVDLVRKGHSNTEIAKIMGRKKGGIVAAIHRHGSREDLLNNFSEVTP